jgi:heme/copper-type cytochrome/quinol oxidase subunit 3
MDNKLLIKLVVVTEALFFLSLLLVFVYFSLASDFRQQQLAALDVRATGGFSLLLFASSFTYWRAEASYRQATPRRLRLWLLLTIGLGILFLLGQAREYHSLFGRHIDIASNTFGTSFFTLTGFHALHVLIGLLVIGILTGLSFAGDYDQPKTTIFSTVGIYWHFVDIVWAVVFLLVYVLPHITHL